MKNHDNQLHGDIIFLVWSMFLKTARLTPQALNVIKNKGTDIPNTGKYDHWSESGTYLCGQCGIALFRSSHKFSSSCGWPSFDDELSSNIEKIPDADGVRQEILCRRCHGHLGHIFYNEGFTKTNARYCVNSSSLDFTSDMDVLDTEEAIFAAGCFWGAEYLFQRLPGVVLTEVGYTGGFIPKPTYKQVCQGNTGHVEAIRVVYDTSRLSCKDVAQYFFEIHDPTQTDGQGPDIGHQYMSVAFYYTNSQKACLNELIHTLEQQGYDIATMVEPVAVFWPAEEYHQHYYIKNQQTPYCHKYQKRF